MFNLFVFYFLLILVLQLKHILFLFVASVLIYLSFSSNIYIQLKKMRFSLSDLPHEKVLRNIAIRQAILLKIFKTTHFFLYYTKIMPFFELHGIFILSKIYYSKYKLFTLFILLFCISFCLFYSKYLSLKSLLYMLSAILLHFLDWFEWLFLVLFLLSFVTAWGGNQTEGRTFCPTQQPARATG